MSLWLLGKFYGSNDHIFMGQSIDHDVAKDKGKNFMNENPRIEYPKQNRNIQSGLNTMEVNKLMAWQHRVY